ncbi:hypothetical protein AXG93_1217s1440 [Marchantia polymorpha subsp. ruderalis]|uniref:Uncharacterized protein n=1 Tax=Marchantia polymorpha subsp. ruderalis TaxID=1480154 RepID=A0A176VUG1_MARPO|nr:hypothetical protein AXG93_1217s1440 [Marchantia polymorpha subsp. ruderalis]
MVVSSVIRSALTGISGASPVIKVYHARTVQSSIKCLFHHSKESSPFGLKVKFLEALCTISSHARVDSGLACQDSGRARLDIDETLGMLEGYVEEHLKSSEKGKERKGKEGKGGRKMIQGREEK